MDLFQLIGDFLHLVAMLMLVLKILNNRSLLGTRCLTQGSPTRRRKSISSCFSPGTSTCCWAGSRCTSS